MIISWQKAPNQTYPVWSRSPGCVGHSTCMNDNQLAKGSSQHQRTRGANPIRVGQKSTATSKEHTPRRRQKIEPVCFARLVVRPLG